MAETDKYTKEYKNIIVGDVERQTRSLITAKKKLKAVELWLDRPIVSNFQELREYLIDNWWKTNLIHKEYVAEIRRSSPLLKQVGPDVHYYTIQFADIYPENNNYYMVKMGCKIDD